MAATRSTDLAFALDGWPLARGTIARLALSAGTRLGKYEIVSALGAGAMGEVYRARDTALGREVAVKVLPPEVQSDPERLRRFRVEAQAASALSHPNVLSVYDFGEEAGVLFLVAELVTGSTLRVLLDAREVTVGKAVDYAAQIASGLAAAHEKGIVHRDLKPKNIIVDGDGRVRIIDFGIAKLVGGVMGRNVGDAALPSTQTEVGAVLGTAMYMSPEQVLGKPLDGRSDIFSLGVVLYEMLAGFRPFIGKTPGELACSILKDEPRRFAQAGRELPPGLERLVFRCLDKEPGQRFQSARDLAFHLQAMAMVASTPGDPIVMAVPKERRGAWRRVAGTLFAVVLVLGGVALERVVELTGAHEAGEAKRPDLALPGTSGPTYRKLTSRNGAIRSARFVPGGDSVLYSADWRAGQYHIYSVLPGGLEARPVLSDQLTLLAVSSTRELAVWKDGVLATAPLAGGALRDLAKGVALADWSPDGARLAMVTGRADVWGIEYPLGHVLYETQAWISSMRVSPSGEEIAFVEHPILWDQAGTVCIVGVDGKKRELTDSRWAVMAGHAWSPRGDEILFAAGQGPGTTAIMAVTPTGVTRHIADLPGAWWLHDVASDGRMLLNRNDIRAGAHVVEGGVELDVSWMAFSLPVDFSTDGRSLLFGETNAGPDNLIYLRRLGDREPVRLGNGFAYDLSPDGKWVLAVVREEGRSRLVMLPTGAGDRRTLPSGRVAMHRLVGGAFLPDGVTAIFPGREEGRPWRVWQQRVDAGDPKPISEEGIVGAGMKPLSPDGRFLVVKDAADGHFLLDLTAGGPLQPLAGIGHDGREVVRWSDDGRELILADQAPTNGRLALHRYSLASRRALPWKDIAVDRGYFWHLVLAPGEETYAYAEHSDLEDLFLVEGLR